MNAPHYDVGPELEDESREKERDSTNKFKKLRRPLHAAKRSRSPARLRGMHRRRNKRMAW